MKNCDCNQGRQPCTCRDVIGEVIEEDRARAVPPSVAQFVGEQSLKAGGVMPDGVTIDQVELARLVRELALRSGNASRPLMHAAAIALESQARELAALKASCPPDVAGLTFNALRAANAERIGSSRYRKCEENWTPAHWMQATVGELGELANLLKKVDRGDFPFDQVKTEVAKELADVQTYLDILALKLGVDLGQATIDKFNEVSARIGSHVVLGEQPQTDSAGFKKGDIVRYSNGCTALARLDTQHAGGWHAAHCLGGHIFVSASYPRPMRRASEEDCAAFEIHRANTLRQQGRAEAVGGDA